MKKYANAGLSIAVFAICLVIGEVFLWIFMPVPDPYKRLKSSEGINQYIKSEFPINYSAKTIAEEGLPGVVGLKNFSVNNLGFRGDSMSIQKPDNEFRIFMIGGSTTECFYLDDDEAVTSVLQESLRHANPAVSVKVYNAGKSGDASDDHVSMLVHRLVNLEPDMIIVFSGINDLARSIYGWDYLHYANSDKDGKPLFRLVLTELQLPRRLYYLIKRITLPEKATFEEIPLRSNYREKIEIGQSVPISDERPEVNKEAYSNNLKTIIGVAKAHDIYLVMLTQQTTWESTIDPNAKNWHWLLYRNGVRYREDVMNAALESLNDEMRKVTEENDIPLYDLARDLPKSTEFFYDDVHFNVKGACVAGMRLASLIAQEHSLLRVQTEVADVESGIYFHCQ